MFPRLVFLACVALIAPASGSDERVVYELGQIEIVGVRDKVPTPGKTERKVEECEQRLDQSVAEAVEGTPGVVTTVGMKNEPQVVFRGVSQQRILVLYDGIPMAAPYFGDLDLSELPLDGLASISMIRGNASVLYGPNALGGVLSLASAVPGERGNFKIVASVDQNGAYATRLTHGRRIGAAYYQVSGGTRQSEGWRLSQRFRPFVVADTVVIENGGIRENAGFHQWSVDAKVGREWEGAELSVSGSHVEAAKGIPPATSPAVRVRFWEFPHWAKSTLTVAGRRSFGEGVEVRGNLFHHSFDNVLREYRDHTRTTLRYESTYDDASVGGVLRGAWRASDLLTLRSALHVVRDTHRALPNPGQSWEEYVATTSALALEGESQPTPWIGLQLGVSRERYDFDSLREVAAEAEAVTRRTRDIDATGLSLAVASRPEFGHTVTLALTKRCRFPTMHQLFSNIESYPASEVPPLAPERALQYALGYEYRPGPWFGYGCSAFRYDVEDLIDRPNRSSLYGNIAEATFQGFEVWASSTLGWLGGTASWTYVEATRPEADGPKDVALVPRHVLHAEFSTRLSRTTRLLGALTSRGRAVQYDDAGRPMTISPYAILDVSLRQSLGRGITLTFQATNLFDRDCSQEVGYPLPGRTLRLGFQFDTGEGPRGE